jgi:hypothetical protein
LRNHPHFSRLAGLKGKTLEKELDGHVIINTHGRYISNGDTGLFPIAGDGYNALTAIFTKVYEALTNIRYTVEDT